MLCFRKTACKVSANRNEKKIMLRKWKNCRHNRQAVGMAAEEVSGFQVSRQKKAGKEVEAKAQAECEEYKKRDKVKDDIAIVKDLHQLFQHGKQSAKNVRRENTCAPQRKTISSAEEKLFLCGRFLLPSAVFFYCLSNLWLSVVCNTTGNNRGDMEDGNVTLGRFVLLPHLVV